MVSDYFVATGLLQNRNARFVVVLCSGAEFSFRDGQGTSIGQS